VRDEGQGVDESELPRIFEPFYRTKDASDAGTGLGLAIADRAIRLNGGSLTATNNKEGGLQIDISLPIS